MKKFQQQQKMQELNLHKQLQKVQKLNAFLQENLDFYKEENRRMELERERSCEAMKEVGSKIYLQMDMINNVYNQDLVNKFVLKTCKKNLELIN